MPVPTVSRLRRAARRSPRYLLRRAGQEVVRELARRELAQARVGRGRLRPAAIVPGGLAAAAAATRLWAAELGAFGQAVELSRRDPVLQAGVRRRLEPALARRVELFAGERLAVGVPPEWDVDPITGTRWPDGFHRRLEIRDIARPTDIKRVWELSRLRHCVAFAQAVVVLDSAEARDALEADLADWRSRNPLGWTVNWTTGMEVALRAVNLICVDAMLLAGGRAIDRREELVASLYQHGWFLYRNLEIGEVNGNHFLADAVGLLWLGAYFGDVGEAVRWRRRGREMTIAAARDQVLADGLDHEGSLPYHVLVLEMFLLALAIGGTELEPCEGPIRRMLDAAVAFTGPDGRVPDLGDDDGGRVTAFVDTPSWDARRVLALGAALTGHAGAAERSRGGDEQDAIWLAGLGQLRAARTRIPVPAPGPVHLGAGGVVVLERGEDRLVVDVGPVGFRGLGGHGHVDALSFVAWVGGEVAVRDSGTGSYTGDAQLRNELRDAFAHSVVIVDQMPYARIGGVDRLWGVDGDAPPEVLELSASTHGQRLVARQTLPAVQGAATVERCWSLAPQRLQWRDVVVAPRGSTVSHLLQLPDACWEAGGQIRHPRLCYEGHWPQHASFSVFACVWSSVYGAVRPGRRAIVSYRSAGEPVEVSWSISRRPATAGE